MHLPYRLCAIDYSLDVKIHVRKTDENVWIAITRARNKIKNQKRREKEEKRDKVDKNPQK